MESVGVVDQGSQAGVEGWGRGFLATSACQQNWPRGETYLLPVWDMAMVITAANADPVLFPTSYLVKPPLQMQR